jgi:hypothetical protein
MSFFIKFAISYTYLCLVPWFHTFWGWYYLGLIKDTLRYDIARFSLSYKTRIVWDVFRCLTLTISLIYYFLQKKKCCPEKVKMLENYVYLWAFFKIFIRILNHKSKVSLIHFCYSMYSCSKKSFHDVLNTIYISYAYLCFILWICKLRRRVYSEANKI